jgi:hypothetical protein
MDSRRLLPALVVVLALLTSCRGEAEGTAKSPATPPAATSSSAPDTSGTEPQLRRHSGPSDLVLERVRVTEHSGGEQVVLDFAGKGRPGWSAQYVDEAVLEGSGDVVDIDGDAILRLDVSGTPRPAPASRAPVPVAVAGDVAEVHVVDAYEGITTVFLGIESGRVPFAVEASRGPSRLVVDLGRGGAS